LNHSQKEGDRTFIAKGEVRDKNSGEYAKAPYEGEMCNRGTFCILHNEIKNNNSGGKNHEEDFWTEVEEAFDVA